MPGEHAPPESVCSPNQALFQTPPEAFAPALPLRLPAIIPQPAKMALAGGGVEKQALSGIFGELERLRRMPEHRQFPAGDFERR